MTRQQTIMIAMLPMIFQLGAARALEASDTMAAWKNASAAEKGVVVDKVLNGHGGTSVIKCVDAASNAPGHSDLPVLRMIKACDKSGNEPV